MSTPKHGTITMYKSRQACRCEPCRAAWSAYGRNRTRQKAYGRWHPYVTTVRVLEHLRLLQDSGMGVRRIGELSGVAHPVITRIRSGRTKQIRPETEARILAVAPGQVAGGARIDGLGACRRLRALTALGWTAPDLAARSSLSVDTLCACTRGETVTARTAVAVRDLYERMWNEHPPESTLGERMKAQRARAKARRNGWARPLQWDEDIDNPDARPALGDGINGIDEVAIERALEGDKTVSLTKEERAEAVRIAGHRLSANDIAKLLGTSSRTIVRDRKGVAA
jgi:hypothetical protein